MIEVLQSLIPEVIESLDIIDEWDSLIVNRRKPWTYRVFRKFGEYRICLHAFDPCMTEESFPHPHPWPGAFLMLKGSYGLCTKSPVCTKTRQPAQKPKSTDDFEII